MTTHAHGQALLDAIITDHREVEAVFVELESGVDDPGTRRELVDHVIAELVRHSVGEEMYVYPAIRRALGDEVADHEIAEHAEAEQVMKQLDGLDPTDAKFSAVLRTLINDIRHHVTEEEQDVLPSLVAACPADELDTLAEKFRQAKKTAPTRPHPSAPDRPPGNRILAPGAGMIDRMRDALSGRST